MDSGVPQGLILGPLLFICYINELPNVAANPSTFLYADDITLLVKGKDMIDAQNKLESDLISIDNWFDHNKLAMNQKKRNVCCLAQVEPPKKMSLSISNSLVVTHMLIRSKNINI